MSILSKLFGLGGEKPEAEPEEYKGFRIYAEPAREGSKFRIGARIEKDVDGVLASHTLIRADMLDDLETAMSSSVNKAKQMIDEQGDRIFR